MIVFGTKADPGLIDVNQGTNFLLKDSRIPQRQKPHSKGRGRCYFGQVAEIKVGESKRSLPSCQIASVTNGIKG